MQGEETTSSTTSHGVGGKTEISVDDQLVNELLKNNMARLVSGDSSLEVVTIKKITKQVVAGLKFEISGTFKKGGSDFECVVTIWHRSWLENANEKVKLKADCGSEKIHPKGDDEW